jgi:hypothetical protein
MQVNVTPKVTEFDEEGYTIELGGTAPLGSSARGWFKTKIAWWPSEAISGMDILLDVPKAAREPASGTEFDAALYWRERRPGQGEPLWAGRYRVRNTPQGPVLEQADRKHGWRPLPVECP